VNREELLARTTSWIEAVTAAYLALLAPAADEHDAIEQVHDFRVALRRLRSVLPALTSGVGKARRRAIEAALREVADATGETRDEEVLDETLTELDLASSDALTHWRHGRGRRLRGTRKRALEALRAELAPVLHEALQRLAEAGTQLPLDASSPTRTSMLLRGRLTALASRTERALEGGTSDDFHRARIGAKKLRYSCEWLASELAPGLVDVAERCAKIQKSLGRLHDLDEALVRMDRARGLTVRAELLTELAARRARSEARARDDLRKQVPKIASTLERALDHLALSSKEPSTGAIEEGGDPQAHADAQGGGDPPSFGPDHPTKQGGHDARTRAVEGVARPDGTA
jgi:CHAD domain-containing protein